MSGAELLAIVRDRFPHTLRIMLSGSADPEDFVRATPFADRLLGKPCDSKTLRATITDLVQTGRPASG
jgi:response regulator RpfG family c-di-GMP phosphodiesterase